MLNESVKQNIISYIDKLISELRVTAFSEAKTGKNTEQLIKEVIKITVNKLTPESKIILNKVYNALKNETLQKGIYDNIHHKRAFYDKDILGLLNQKYRFEIPQNIDYQSCKTSITHLEKAGAICVAGGVVSFVVSSSIPICLAIVIAGLMFVSGSDKGGSNDDAKNVIDNYLKNVKIAFLNWVESIEKFYDQQIQELENGF